jgi:DNA-directed RNA polymerase specialized sigma24 family protein
LSTITRPEVDARLEAAYRAQFSPVRKYLRSRLSDKERAEDLAVETFMTFRGKLEAGEDIRDTEAFLIGIAKWHLSNEVQQLARDSELIELMEPATMVLREEEASERGHVGPSPAMTIEDVEFQVDHDRAVRALPAPMRDSYILAELRGLTTREAAEILGDRDHSTVVRQANAARGRIRAALHP